MEATGVSGRTDPQALAQHRDYRCHAYEAEIIAAVLSENSAEPSGRAVVVP
jgi:hypothetical protein